MKTAPSMSVLIPAYNVEEFVEASLQSVLTQTLRDLEIIAVDDCSTDRTLSILENIAVGDSRVKVVSLRKNGGIVEALNEGLKHCSGPFIARMDADDIAVPTRLDRQLKYLNEHREVDLVSSSTCSMDEDGRVGRISSVPCGAKAISATMLIANPCIHIWLARRTVYEHLNGYRAVAPAEDYDFVLRAVSAGFQIANIAEPLMQIRIRRGNTSDVAGLKQRKAHDYVVHLHRERMKTGADTYNPEMFEKVTLSHPFEIFLHRQAARISRSAFSSSYALTRVALLSLSALISPWQAKYFLSRARLKLLLRLLSI